MTSTPAQVGFPTQRPRTVVADRAHLGLDLGTHMGYAALDDTGRIIDAGVWDFSPTGRERKNDPGKRWVRVANDIGAWFAALRARHLRFGTVSYEIVRRHEGVLAAHVFGAMEGFLLAQVSRFGLSVDTVEVADLKLIATGKGNSPKGAVMVAARSKWGDWIDIDKPHADNLCDALFVAEMARRRTLGVAL